MRTACQYFITSWGHIMGVRMEADMRMDLFKQYQRLSFGYYRNNTGEMMSKLVTDLFDVSELAHHGPENLFICILKIVGSFALLFFINVPLTAIMLGATVLLAAYAAWRNYRKRLIFTENRKKMADINARLQDSLGGIRVVKSFGNESVEIGKFSRVNDRFVGTKESSYRFMGSFHAVNSLFIGVLYAVTVVGGGYFVAQGELAVTDLAIYALYIGIFISPIEQLINSRRSRGLRRLSPVHGGSGRAARHPGMCGGLTCALPGRRTVSMRPLAARRERAARVRGERFAIATCGSATMVGATFCGGSTWPCLQVSPWRW